MGHKPAKWEHNQFAALPYRVRQGNVEFLFVTSRDTRQWIMPKGKPETRKGKPLPPHSVAKLEALQEAGVKGPTRKKPVGEFSYNMRVGDESFVSANVHVFLLRVTEEKDEWKESDERKRMWLTVRQAKGRLLKNSHIPKNKHNRGKIEALFANTEHEIIKAKTARRRPGKKLARRRSAAPR